MARGFPSPRVCGFPVFLFSFFFLLFSPLLFPLIRSDYANFLDQLCFVIFSPFFFFFLFLFFSPPPPPPPMEKRRKSKKPEEALDPPLFFPFFSPPYCFRRCGKGSLSNRRVLRRNASSSTFSPIFFFLSVVSL